MAQSERFETLVLGSGAGGKHLAWHLAQSGQRTGLVERRWIGGSCPNINCLPSKNEIWSAKVADLVCSLTVFDCPWPRQRSSGTGSSPATAKTRDSQNLTTAGREASKGP
jgi:choline dehydrogenase-like flavoprotein